ncbi:MAG: pyruvate formate lyase-activating protein [Candidatus Aenigmarchaeota archaeon]|nr:pyruvate formate lyase-activating protein [Candidatus Aenigmarchaeota archaeon]
MKGRINSIQSFGTLDGPGIRYVVFMQGCPLKCVFCHNSDLITPLGGKQIEPEELMRKIDKCIPYLKNGGITISGGEPTMQWEFVRELLTLCRQKNIHTAIDTCLYTQKKVLDALLPVVDLFLVSVKQIDEKEHLALTGKTNKLILENIKYVASKKPVWLRYVLISGKTDSEKDINQLIKFAEQLKNLELIELLPYSSLGEDKWDDAHKARFKDLTAPPQEKINDIKKSIEKNNIKILM